MSMVRRNGRYTIADYATWPEDERWELIDGEAYAMTPAPNTRHQQISVKLTAMLDSALGNTPCIPYHAPTDVTFDEAEDTNTVVEPDLFVMCGPHGTGNRVTGVPVLVIEILSPLTARRDKVVKRALYERVGVKEYWLVDPANEIIDVLVQDGGRLSLSHTVGREDTLQSTALPSVVIDVNAVFAQRNLDPETGA